MLVLLAGYAIGNSGGNGSPAPAATLALRGTSAEPHARASLEVWHPKDGNWPMTLTVLGLSKLPARRYYEVYVVRNGQILGSCGIFRVASSSRPVVVTLNAPYPLEKGDSWVVTRQGANGAEPGTTVLRPAVRA